MTKSKIYLIVFMLPLLAIFACKKENEKNENVVIEYYPHANQMDTIHCGGLNRTYKLHVPVSYSASTKTALVIGLHGYTGSATSFENQSQFSDKADAEGFIVAYPNGLNYPWTSTNPQAWNVGGPYEEWTRYTDDIGFIDQMIELICKYYSIDRNKIYATGHSNGSRMTYRVGHELSCKIAAIAAHSGPMIYEASRAPECMVPILHLHALNDNTVKYYGDQTQELKSPPVDSILDLWANWYSCNINADTTFQNADYLIKSWISSGDTIIQLYVAKTGMHNWFEKSNSGIEATDVIWEFFKAHPKKDY